MAVLPGIYTTPDRSNDLGVRIRAVGLWEPDAVLTGTAAARVTFWPHVRVRTVGAALPRNRRSPSGYSFCRRRVPPELVVEHLGLRLTAPALTALELCDEIGGDGIDALLRSRHARLSDLWQAIELTPCRSGNVARRRLLLESRSEPWSAAERATHALLHRAGISGWQANVPVLVHGVTFYLDVAFAQHMLALEIDGRDHHSSAAAFERDRWRQNQLVLAGWQVLRFTWDMITNRSEMVMAQVLQALDPEKWYADAEIIATRRALGALSVSGDDFSG